MKRTAECLEKLPACLLGEGPVWDARRQRLYWIDIEGKSLSWTDDEHVAYGHLDLPERPGCLALCDDPDSLIVALESGFFRLNLASERLEPIIDPEADLPDNRFNDGKCDPAGRFWAGTMPMKGSEPTGNLWMLEGNGRIEKRLSSVSCSNGIAWSADAKCMYYIDTGTGKLDAFDFDVSTGNIRNRRTVHRFVKDEGLPDGMCIDEEGCLWVARWGGGRVSRIDPRTGLEIGRVEIPVSRVTCCAFGGPNLDRLYVTTAQGGLPPSPGAHSREGSIFAIDLPVRGLETPLFPAGLINDNHK